MTVVVGLSEYVGVVLQVWIYFEETTEPPVQVVKVRVGLALHLTRLDSIRHIG